MCNLCIALGSRLVKVKLFTWMPLSFPSKHPSLQTADTRFLFQSLTPNPLDDPSVQGHRSSLCWSILLPGAADRDKQSG